VELVAADWLDRDVIACLEEKCGTLVDAVLIAYASGGVGDELHSLGVREISTFGGADVYVPEGRERVVWARVVEYHDCVSPQPQAAKRPRHRPPDPIPLATVKDLKWELAQRKAKPRDPELTQEKIAGRLGLDRTRVQQAEAGEGRLGSAEKSPGLLSKRRSRALAERGESRSDTGFRAC
jgi:hypothetical protein